MMRAAAKNNTQENTPEKLFQSGYQLHQQGKVDEAMHIYQQVLEMDENHFACLHMLGVLQAQSGHPQLAFENISKALTINDKSAAAWANCANALNELGRWQEALSYLEKAIELDDKFINAYFSQGVAHFQLSLFQQACESFRQVVALNNDHVDANRYLMQSLIQTMQWQEALDLSEKLIALQGESAEIFWQQARVLNELKRSAEALECIDRVLALSPQLTSAHALRGLILMALNQPQQAIVSLRIAVEHHPQDLESYSNLGLCLQEMQMIDEAIESFDHAIAISPQHPDLNWNKSLALLLRGDFEQGWRLFEWRRQLARNPQPVFEKPIWLGDAPLNGKTILIYAEQGLGDTLQFCRYIPMVADLGAKVIFAVPKALLRVMAQIPKVYLLASEGQSVPVFDYHCPLMSLPLAFKTTLDSIPRAPAYLRSYVNDKQAWLQRLGVKTQPRIGLVWSGRPEHGNDINRSIRLEQILPLLAEGVDYISLQKDVREVDLPVLQQSQILDFSEHLKDFADTAALCDCMDLIITVDTSVAHLAAAMGRVTWLLLPYTPDYRWLLERDDTPWYPSVKLYRQHQHADWSQAFAQLSKDLKSFIQTTQQGTTRA